MSETRLLCDRCGFPQCDCSCGKAPVRRELKIMATPEDLDHLRAVFEEMASDPDSEGHAIAKRVMAAVHRCRRKHGFKWEH